MIDYNKIRDDITAQMQAQISPTKENDPYAEIYQLIVSISVTAAVKAIKAYDMQQHEVDY